MLINNRIKLLEKLKNSIYDFKFDDLNVSEELKNYPRESTKDYLDFFMNYLSSNQIDDVKYSILMIQKLTSKINEIEVNPCNDVFAANILLFMSNHMNEPGFLVILFFLFYILGPMPYYSN